MTHPKLSPRRVARKYREAKRVLRNWTRWMAEVAANPPLPADCPRDYWHQRLALPPAIDGRRTPKAVRKAAIEMFLQAAGNLRAAIAPEHQGRVVCGICVPSLVDSDLSVMYGEYFDHFFNRKSECQNWSALPAGRSLQREWQLSVPAGLGEIGVLEVRRWDEDEPPYICEIWWFGDIEGIAEQLASPAPAGRACGI